MQKQAIQIVIIAVVAFISITKIVNAQTGGDFTISKSTIASGGGISNNASYSISGTTGQPEASNQSTGGDFSLTGGFWSIGIIIPKPDAMFMDGFETTTNKQLR